MMEKQINIDGSRKEKRQISAYTLDKFTKPFVREQLSMISILHNGLCKHNDKKTYQVSKHHTNG